MYMYNYRVSFHFSTGSYIHTFIRISRTCTYVHACHVCVHLYLLSVICLHNMYWALLFNGGVFRHQHNLQSTESLGELCTTRVIYFRETLSFSVCPTTPPLPAPQRFQFIHQFRSLETFTMNDRLQLFNFGIFIS